MQTLKHKKKRIWRSLKVVLIPPTPTKARKGVKITLEEPMLQEYLMLSKIQVSMNIIKEFQDITTSKLHQDNPHLPGIKLYFLVIVTLVQIFGTWKKIVGLTTKVIKTLEGNLQVDNNELQIDLTVQ